ncbi:MAG: 4Fe-4S binding protein [Dehalococcoidia bacterium]|nr:4Fe-4S binding protein [Dehalococcoidia bacterium]
MTNAIYDKLADKLSSIGGAIPALKCREFFDLVEELFTPEEAELATNMPLSPIPAETFARDIGSDPKEVERLLETMIDKGLVFTLQRGEVRFYNLMVLVPGIFEMQFMKGEVNDRARKLARLFEDYFNAVMQPSAAAPTGFAAFPFARVIPVEEDIPAGVEIHPYDRVSEYISKADYIAVSICYCRHHGELLGNPCDKPKDVCMSFGPNAKFLDERGFARLVSKEEALDILDRSEEAGLIHCSSNTGKYIDFICNCCGCHCGILRSIKNAAVPSMGAVSSFVMTVDEEECVACEACVDRCQMDALTMEGDTVVRSRERCIGCGLCVSVCPTDALKLEPREGAPVPPFDRQEFNVAMMSSLSQNR